MWKAETVERTLMNWGQWRRSLIHQWANPGVEPEELNLEELKNLARKKVEELEFRHSFLFELYWFCCLTSDFNFGNEHTYKNVKIPNWLALPYDEALRWCKIDHGIRMHPPLCLTLKDLGFFDEKSTNIPQLAESIAERQIYDCFIFITDEDPFYQELLKNRGRPSGIRRNDPAFKYSDRIAVKCATLKDRCLFTYVEIARKFKLPVTTPFFSEQSEVARYLVAKGRRLIQSVSLT